MRSPRFLASRTIIPLLVERVADAKLNPVIRATALRSLARLDHGKAVELSREVKMLPATELLLEALNVLAKYDAKNSLPRFIEATQSRSMDVRQLGWDILAKSDTPEALGQSSPESRPT